MPKLKLNIDKPWAKETAIFLGGGVAGVLVDKIVGTAWVRASLPNPDTIPNVSVADLVLITGELAVAYKYRKKKPRLSKAMVAMAGAVVVTDVYEAVVPWNPFRAQLAMRQTVPMRLNIRPAMMNGVASTGLSYPQTGARGKYAVKTNGAVTAAGYGIGRYGR